jgi:hypothetical protein
MLKLSPFFLTIALIAFFAPIANADSGGATLSTLPESEEVQASVTVRHDCSEEDCFWFGEAAAYSASAGCPYTFDVSHSVWVGDVESEGGVSFGTFAFSPYGLSNPIVLCLYVNVNSENSLVGESHEFDLNRGSEVLPQPPARDPAKTAVGVTVRGCRVWPHVTVNGTKRVGGDIHWAVYRVGPHHITLLGGGTSAENSSFEPGEYKAGIYRFSARFLGDANLLPSPTAESTTFRVKHC